MRSRPRYELPRSYPTRSRFTTSLGWWPAPTAVRAWATSSWPTSVRLTRSCTSCASMRTRTSSTPRADIDTIETELVYADLEQAERRLDRVAKAAKTGDRSSIAEAKWLGELVGGLQAGRPGRTGPPPADAPPA